MIALLLALAATVLLPLHKLEWQSFPFLAAAAVAGLFAASSKIPQTRYRPGAAILAFWVVCLAHVTFVFLEDVTVGEYLRGLVPFIFLTFFFVTVRLATLANFGQLFHGVIVVGLLYAAQNLVLLPKFLSGEVWRTTFENVNHAIPFPQVAFHFCVALALSKGVSPIRKTLLVTAAAVLLLSSFLTGTRSLILASLAPLLWIPFSSAKLEMGRLTRYAWIVALLGAVLLFVPADSLMKSARIGYTQAGSIDTRMQENEVALRLIAKSPIVGNGLGFRFDTNGLYYQATRVGYVHNSYLYLLMDFGIFGLLYVAAPVCALRSLQLVRKGPHADHAAGLTMALAGLLIFSLGFALVRLMHFNILLGCVMGMLEVLKRDYAMGWRAWRYQMKLFTNRMQAAARLRRAEALF